MRQRWDSIPLAVPAGQRPDRHPRSTWLIDQPKYPPAEAGDAAEEFAAGRSFPSSPAEVAQARLFDELLCAEIVRLQQIATSAAGRRADRGERTRRTQEAPKALAELRGTIDEAHCLLEALRRRFPGGLPAPGPSLAD